MTDYEERLKSEWRMRLAQMYNIKPDNETFGFYDKTKADNWRMKNVAK